MAVAASRDGKYVYIGGGSSVGVVNTTSNQIAGRVLTRSAPNGCLVVSPDGRRVYVGCNGGLSVISFSAGGWSEIGFISGVGAMGMGISPDGKHLFTTDWSNCTCQVIDTERLQIEKTINLIPAGYTQGWIPWEGYYVKAAGQAMGLSVSPDGGRAVVAIWAGSFASVLDLQSQSLSKGVSLDGRSYQAAAYSPDGSLIYLSHYDGHRIVVLDAASNNVITYLTVAAQPSYIAITPDGTQLYVAHEGGDVEVIGLPDGRRIRTYDVNAHTKFMSIAFSSMAV